MVSVYHVLNIVLSVCHVLRTYLIFTTTLGGKYHYPHFIDKETGFYNLLMYQRTECHWY